ncbi:xyloglucan O-acetyltransferase 3 [Silene latifolia]|uniref:xyloglucan O-acetyltransferase 3 n=1 Tax=Silene latifolia TaxID=37657 RepID=UPI003D781D7F
MMNKIHESNTMKHNYLKGGLPPLFLWSLALISIFSLFLLYSPTPFLFSSTHDQLPHNIRPLIKPKIFFEDDNCELFKGTWVPDLNVSHYTSTSCTTIPDSKNCFKHGRKDKDFLNWRWNPQSCELSKFDPKEFLQIVNGKNLGFIGDSVARNHIESLLCLLSQTETPTDVYKDSEDRFRTWYFPSSNFTLMIFWSKFLVKSEERMVNNSGTGSFNLHLDQVDQKWASKLPALDYAIISAAHWFFRQNYLYHQGKLIGCVYCNEPNVTELGLNYALRMSIREALKHINECKECKTGMLTFVRTFSPAHFENGAWNTGGTCNRTGPDSEEKAKERSFELELGELQVEELERARKDASGLGSRKRFRALDVTRVMLMRPDGHPGEHWGNKYMQGYNDCVHWCMPGPIDVWNDLLLAVMMREDGFSQ